MNEVEKSQFTTTTTPTGVPALDIASLESVSIADANDLHLQLRHSHEEDEDERKNRILQNSGTAFETCYLVKVASEDAGIALLPKISPGNA